MNAGQRLMGIGLIVEVLDSRPPVSAEETVLLLAIAEDAREETRIGMPGMEALARRCRCSKRTLTRRLASLVESGALQVVSRSAPGRRAEFRIPPMNWTDATTLADVPGPVDNPAAEPVDNSATDASVVASVRTAERTPDPAERTPPLLAPPPSNNPQPSTDPPVTRSVEGARDPASVDTADFDQSLMADPRRPPGLTDDQWAEIAWLAPASAELAARHAALTDDAIAANKAARYR